MLPVPVLVLVVAKTAVSGVGTVTSHASWEEGSFVFPQQLLVPHAMGSPAKPNKSTAMPPEMSFGSRKPGGMDH